MMFKIIENLLIVSIVILSNCSTNYADPGLTPGESYYGKNSYIEYIPGNMPLIISVPHGGYIEPNDIEERDCGWNHSDTKCIELARAVKDSIFKLTGEYPYIIINNLKRSKLDPNREEFEATCGDTVSLPYYYEYHKFIDSAKAMVTKHFGKGLYIDLHGHNHKAERLEIGYILNNLDLEKSDLLLDDTSFINKSSIRRLAHDTNMPFSKLIRGETSLGSLFENYGYPAVPSNRITNPGKEEFFQGGYDTDIHGSSTGGTIDGIQVETNKKGIRDSMRNVNIFAGKFTTVLLEYLKLYYYK
jgi:hypothetical protein